jgi:hypothetical protein
VRAGRRARPDRDHVADARLGGQGVAGRRVAVNQARAGRGVVADVRPGPVAEADAEDHAAVADRHVRRAVGVDAVRVGADAGLLDHRREIDCYEAARAVAVAHARSPAACVASTPMLASASSIRVNASDGPLMMVDGPGPCPYSWQLPVEITPMLVHPSR